MCADGNSSEHIICGLSSQHHIALLTIQGPGLQGITGIASRLFTALAQVNINIILISQASSEQSICFVVPESDANNAKNIVDTTFSLEIKADLVAPISIDKSVSIIAVVGDNMRQRIGIAGSLFYSLSKARVNIMAIAQGSSELNISIVIHKDDETIALRALHAGFFETKEPMQLFVFGASGLIGSTLMQQLTDFQSDTVSLELYGLANSKHMIISDKPLDASHYSNDLNNGTASSISDFIHHVKQHSHLPKRIFVDCSANDDVCKLLRHLAQ